MKGENDLETLCPNIAKEWHPTLNGDLKPSDVTTGSGKKVFWICEKGHSYDAKVHHRVGSNSGCPYCSGRLPIEGVNDLLTNYPEIDNYWDYDNNEKKPSEYLPKSEAIVSFKCNEGHSWKTRICNFIRNIKCPYCTGKKLLIGSNDLQTCYPNIAEEWDYERNKGKPSDYFKTSNQSVWWKCNNGHKWFVRISARTVQGNGCPYCSGKKASSDYNLTKFSKNLLLEWDYERNSVNPIELTPHSSTKVWWKCKFGHSWLAAVSNRVNGTNCPQCKKSLKTSFPEQAIFYYISKIYNDAINCDKSFGFELDIYIPSKKIGIEYDGYGFHKTESKRKVDAKKNQLCINNEIKLIRILENGLKQFDDCICVSRMDNTSIPSLDAAINDIFKILNKNVKVDVEHDYDKIYAQYKLSEDGNSIKSLYPNLVLEWDHEKNGSLKPEMFSSGSGKKVWWKCQNGHSWQTCINVRCKGHGCPICGHTITEIKKRKKVQCIEMNKIYDSIVEAAIQTGINKNSIIRCCKGKQNVAGGYHWKYDDN